MARRIPLTRHDGPTKVWLDAVLHDDGSFTLAGYDLGQAPQEAYGREDLEYELTIPAASVPATLAAVLGALLANETTPVTALRRILDNASIPHRFRFIP